MICWVDAKINHVERWVTHMWRVSMMINSEQHIAALASLCSFLDHFVTHRKLMFGRVINR